MLNELVLPVYCIVSNLNFHVCCFEIVICNISHLLFVIFRQGEECFCSSLQYKQLFNKFIISCAVLVNLWLEFFWHWRSQFFILFFFERHSDVSCYPLSWCDLQDDHEVRMQINKPGKILILSKGIATIQYLMTLYHFICMSTMIKEVFDVLWYKPTNLQWPFLTFVILFDNKPRYLYVLCLSYSDIIHSLHAALTKRFPKAGLLSYIVEVHRLLADNRLIPIIGQFADNRYRPFDSRHWPIICFSKQNYLFYIGR